MSFIIVLMPSEIDSIFFWNDLIVPKFKNITDYYIVGLVFQLGIRIYSQRICTKMHEMLATYIQDRTVYDKIVYYIDDFSFTKHTRHFLCFIRKGKVDQFK